MAQAIQYRKGFTLIELLIVVAIIGILAAIAVPNFQNAQTRSKIARVKSDLRSLALAIDSYRLDNNAYPYPLNNQPANAVSAVKELTTPIAYIANVDIEDPFTPKGMFVAGENTDMETHVYANLNGRWGKSVFTTGPWPDGFCVKSQGPDHYHSGGCKPAVEVYQKRYIAGGAQGIEAGNPWDKIYNPSNGLYSIGDIPRYGGESAGLFETD